MSFLEENVLFDSGPGLLINLKGGGMKEVSVGLFYATG